MKPSALHQVLHQASADLEGRFDRTWVLTEAEQLDFAAGIIYLLSEEAEGSVRQILESLADTVAGISELVD